jgi:rare lipoprotein A
MVARYSIILLLFITALTACASSSKQTSSWIGYSETGEASYYAMKYQFRKTASGERFDQQASTAAHKQLPFGSRVKVTNVKNRESVIVRINDRGPFIRGRIIDLSRSAFAEIADPRVGVIEVEIEVIN